MTECEEVAYEIWVKLPKPIVNYADAERIAALSLKGESQTVIDNVAEALWQLQTESENCDGY